MQCPFCDKRITTGKHTRNRDWLEWVMQSYDRLLVSHGQTCASLCVHLLTRCGRLSTDWTCSTGPIKVTYYCTCGAGFSHCEPLAAHIWEMKGLTDEEHKAVGLLMGSRS